MTTQANNLFMLDTEELAVIQGKFRAENRLPCAVMLKFFQLEDRYPTQADTFSEIMTRSLSEQLNCDCKDFNHYNWENRTAKRFRQEIRSLLAYTESSVADGKKLIEWLTEEILPLSPTSQQLRDYASQFFREKRLEPFSQKMLSRYIRSSIHRFEKKFFSTIFTQLSTDTVILFDSLLGLGTNNAEHDPEIEEETEGDDSVIKLCHLKKDVAGIKLKHVQFETEKLRCIRSISLTLPESLKLSGRKLLQKYYLRIMAATPGNILEYIPETRYAIMSCFFHIRAQKLTDNLADFFIKLIQKMKSSAQTHVNKTIISGVKRVNGKFDILYLLTDTANSHPEGIIQDKIYPKVSKETLQELVKDLQHKGKWYQKQVNTKIRSLYSHSHRKVLLTLLDAFIFHANSAEGHALLAAIAFIKLHRNISDIYYPDAAVVPVSNVIPSDWKSLVMEKITTFPAKGGQCHYEVNRFNYEVAVLGVLRKQLRHKSVWIEGAYRYRNPNEDLPGNWNTHREDYYQRLGLPMDGPVFVKTLRESLHQALRELNDTILNNDKVKILEKNGGHIKLTPHEPQAEPVHLDALKREINRRWATINLIDILKETDLRVDFTKQFHTVANREILDKNHLQKRLLLAIYGIGSNTGLKRVSAANDDTNYSDLRYVKRWHLNEANVKAATVEVINHILEIRDPKVWGEATTGCACDSTQVSSWDQNLMSEWHPRYKDHGVMIY